MKLVALLIIFTFVMFLKAVKTEEDKCPGYRTCSFNKDRNVPTCYCDEDCNYYNDCCADFGRVLMSVGIPKTEAERRHRMSSSSCEFIPEESNIGVRVISSCRSDFNPKCHQTMANRDLLDMLFVTGSDGLTYKNRHCAICNDIDTFKLWSLQFSFTRAMISTVRDCFASVFENITTMSYFDMASYLIMNCEYRFLPPLDYEPRLCIRDHKICNAAIWNEDNPYQITKSSNPFTMTTLFSFDEKKRMKNKEFEGSRKSGKYSIDVILSSRVVSQRLWFHSDIILNRDQLYKLADSLFLFLQNALPEMKFIEPFFIDYTIVGAEELRMAIFFMGESEDPINFSRYVTITNWLNTVKFTYQETFLNITSQSTYNVVSTMPWEPITSTNKSFEVARVRYYTDSIYVESGLDIFGGKRETLYNEKHIFNKGNSYPLTMCGEIKISFTSFKNETLFESNCVVNATIKQSRACRPCMTVVGMYLVFAIQTVLQ